MQEIVIETTSAALANSTYKLTISLQGLAESAGMFAEALLRITTSPDRYPNESLWDYGNRLAAYGLLDDPDTRWLYQQAVLSSPFRVVSRWWGKRV